MVTLGAILLGVGLIITSVGLGLLGLVSVLHKGEMPPKNVVPRPVGYVMMVVSVALLASGIAVLVYAI